MACQATNCTSSGTQVTLGANATGGTLAAGMTITWPAQNGIATTALRTGGSGYDAGGTHTYTAVPLTGGSGSGAQATIVVTAGVVTSVTITAAGTAYQTSDKGLSASNANLGGSGSGLLIDVTTLSGQPNSPALTLTTLFSGGGSTSGSVWNTSAALGIGGGGTTLTFTAYVTPALGVSPLAITAVSSQVPVIVLATYGFIPVQPLPRTLIGSTTQSSYST